MNNFSTVQYLKIDDIFDIIRKNKYKINMIYKNNYIELKFEDVNVLLLHEDNQKILVVEDNTPAENMRLVEKVKYENLLWNEKNFSEGIINIIYNENISFEIVRCKNREAVFNNIYYYRENVTIHKRENELLDILFDLKINAKEDNTGAAIIFKREENLLRRETFKFEKGKRKVFCDPRYNFRAEGCYGTDNVIDACNKEYGIYRFWGREDLEVFLNGKIFMNEPKEIVSYSILKENVTTDLWNRGFYNKLRGNDKYIYNEEKQKNINGITKVEGLYIIEFDEDTTGIGEFLFDDPSYTEDLYTEDEDFGCVDDDDIPF